MPKALLINSSPRKNGNTAAMLSEISAVLKSSDIDVETLHIGGKPVLGCRACGKCGENKNLRCAIDDSLSDSIAKALTADALIVGTPTYFSDLTPEAKAFIDRCGFAARSNDFALEKKIGAAAVAVRRAGAVHAMDSINHFFLINKMFVAGSSYWNLSIARDIGDYAKDEEGVQTMKDLGSLIAWFLKKTA